MLPFLLRFVYVKVTTRLTGGSASTAKAVASGEAIGDGKNCWDEKTPFQGMSPMFNRLHIAILSISSIIQTLHAIRCCEISIG